MTSGARAALRTFLEGNYKPLLLRLRKYLGSEELASDVLQETWVKLGDMNDETEVRQPASFIFKTAVNIARTEIEKTGRKLTALELAQILSLPETTLDPEQLASVGDDIRMLENAAKAMPPRRRAIFYAALIDERPHNDIAQEFAISTRMVRLELKAALRACGEALERNPRRRFPMRPVKPSKT